MRRLLLIAALLAALCAAGAGLWLARALPGLDARAGAIAAGAEPLGTRVWSADGVAVDALHAERRYPVALEALPELTVRAFLAAEDRRFFEHPGVDPRAVLRAAWADLRAGAFSQGGSTITQQLVKLRTGRPGRGLGAKLDEALLAWRLERRLSKAQILEAYLNAAPFGVDRFGLEAAALDLFGVPARELSVDQAALLAGLLVAPSRLDPRRHPGASAARRDRVLAAMADEGWIPSSEALRYKSAPPELAPETPTPAGRAYVTEARRQLEGLLGERLTTGGFQVTLALDTRVQALAQAAVAEAVAAVEDRQGPIKPELALAPGEWTAFLERGWGLSRDGAGALYPPAPGDCFPAVWSAERRFLVDQWSFELHPGERSRPARGLDGRLATFEQVAQTAQVWRVCLEAGEVVRLGGGPWAQGAAVVMENATGRVLALVGGREDTLEGFNRATQALRQPGSSFKIVVYAAALEAGWTPEMPWGAGSLTRALADSDNAAALRLASAVGHEAVIATGRAMGLRTPLEDHRTLPLGSREVTVLDQAVVAATVARGGRRPEPVLIDQIADAGGRVIARAGEALPAALGGGRLPGGSAQAISERAARELAEMLAEVVRSGTGRAAWSAEQPRAGKTGTTDRAVDAWFVGSTPEHTVAVWIGSDRRISLGAGEGGAATALPAWVAIAGGLPQRP
jgi:penicillin-binding protein 1A